MNNQTTFAIGIPTINRADLLQPALEKYCRDFPNTAIYVLDNGNQTFDVSKLGPNVFWIKTPHNIGVSASWNELLRNIYDGIPGFSNPCQYAMVLNDDIELGKNENQIHRFIVENLFFMAVGEGTWCAWILSKVVFSKVGAFDTKFFPAYYEDNDYAYRLLLAGFKHTCHPELNPEVYRNSQTIAKDPELNANFERNKQYYIQKWGGEPMKETFMTPFNELP